MQKHFFKFKKVLTNIACSPLILLSNNSELVAKYLPNDIEQSITTFENKGINNCHYPPGGHKKQKMTRSTF